ERHQAVDLVIAVGPPADDAQRQVDLGEAAVLKRRGRAAHGERFFANTLAATRLALGGLGGGAGIILEQAVLELLLDALEVVALPLFGALVADAAEIIVDPVLLFGLLDRGEAGPIGIAAFGELLAAALDVAERHDGFEIARIGRDDLLETLLGLIDAVEAVEV